MFVDSDPAAASYFGSVVATAPNPLSSQAALHLPLLPILVMNSKHLKEELLRFDIGFAQ